VVIGAGLAGLACAWRLARRGFEVSLLERSDRVGGRAAALRREGFAFETAPALMTGGERTLLAWIVELGLRDELLPLRPVVTAVIHRGQARDVDVRGLADVRRVPGVRPLHALRLVRLPRLLARYGDSMDPERPELAARFDDRSVADFCRLYFGSSVFEGWMGPRVSSGSLGDPEQMSRVQLLRHLRMHAFQRSGLPRAPLEEVAERAAAALVPRLRVEAETLASRRSGGLRVSLRGGEALRADAVVVATPAPEALRLAAPLLTAAERDGLAAVRYWPSIGLAASLCRTVGARPRHVLVPHAEPGPLESVLIEPGMSGGRAPAGRALAIVRSRGVFGAGALATPPEALEKELLAAFGRICHGAQRAVGFAHVFRHERATPRFDVGRYREIARFERVQTDRRGAGRRLYFAGDYLVDPSWEGALISAERAAAALETDIRQRPPARAR
jgi:oxygen-dependent protoporphyrinogen oxidase